MDREKRSLFGHTRTVSLAAPPKASTYGRKKKSNHTNTTLYREHADYQLWNKPDETRGQGRRTASQPVTSKPPVVGLGLQLDDFNKENESSSWEAETTEVLQKIRPVSMMSFNSTLSVSTVSAGALPSPRAHGQGAMSRLARALSTMSTSSASSKDTIDASTGSQGIRSAAKRLSQSSMSTIHRFSIGSSLSRTESVSDTPGKNRVPIIGVSDATNLRRSSVAQNLSSILKTDDSDDDDADRVTGLVVPFDVASAKPSIPERRRSVVPDHLDSKSRIPEVQELGIPARPQPLSPISMNSPPNVVNSPQLPLHRRPVASTPSITESKHSQSPSIDGSISPMLSFKRDGSSVRHRKVTKSIISLPTSNVNSEDFFSDRPSIDSTESRPEGMPRSSSKSFLSSFNAAATLRSLRRRDSDLASIHSNSGSISGASNPAPPRGKHGHKLSFSGFSKKTSLSDMKRMIPFSPSSSSLFRSPQLSQSNGSSSGKFLKPRQSPSMKDGFDRSMISLPTPVDGSREKLMNKLRASSSLLSLTPSESGDSVGVPVAEYEQNKLSQLLSLCTSQEIVKFDSYIDVQSSGLDLAKLAEASFSEVFVERDNNMRVSKVLKVIPFGRQDLDQLPVQDIIQELTIARLLMSVDGFVEVLDASIVHGKYSQRLLGLWDDYKTERGSENYRPDYFQDDQMYCIIVMAHAGTDLEHFEVESWHDALSIFWQVAAALARAEDKFEFEHRDLHWGNVVIQDPVANTSDLLANLSLDDGHDVTFGSIGEEQGLQVTLIDYTLSRATAADGRVVYTRLDHPDFFRGKGDYQFDIYRFMRSHVSAVGGSPNLAAVGSGMTPPLGATEGDMNDANWSVFSPRTNVMWLHYLADKLLHAKGLQPVTATRSGRLSFGPSNGSLRDGFTSARGLGDEARACGALEIVYRSLDPRKKRFGSKKTGAQMSFQDFNKAKDVLQWGIHNRYVPDELA